MSSTLAGLPDLVKAENLDIMFIQEVCISTEQIRKLLRGYDAAVNYDEQVHNLILLNECSFLDNVKWKDG